MRTVIFAVTALLLTACLKNPADEKKTREDYGPETTADAIDAELDLMPMPNFWSIRKGDLATIAHWQLLENREMHIHTATETSTAERVETPADVTLTWRRRIQEYENNKPKPGAPTGVDFVETINKPASTFFGKALESLLQAFKLRFSFIAESAANPAELKLGKPMSNSIATMVLPKIFAENMSAPDTRIRMMSYERSYHNFSSVPADIPVPTAARARTNCGGPDPGYCDRPIKGHRIAFDTVHWLPGQDPVKVSQMMISSSDVPFFIHDTYDPSCDCMRPRLRSFVKICSEGLIQIQGAKVHVIDCNELSDIALGKVTQP